MSDFTVKVKKQSKPTIISATVLILFIVQQLCSKIGIFIANQFSYHWIDPEGIFAWISVHHITQMFLAIVVIILVRRIKKIDFGFRIGNVAVGLKYTITFSVIIFIYVLIIYFVRYAFFTIMPYPYILNAKNIGGSMLFQILLSGPSEEILFRALPITVLVSIMGGSKKIKVQKWHTSLEIIIAAALFSIAHINWSIAPFWINADYSQLLYALVLGLAYGKAYQESKSIIYPMAMHSISNFIYVGIGFIFDVI